MVVTSKRGKVSCLQPITIVNPHYRKLQPDKRLCQQIYGQKLDYLLSVGCGKCFLCKRKYQSAWRIRLNHEYMFGNHDLSKSWFVTLTLNESYYKLALNNPSKLIRDFLERYREKTRQKFGRKNGKSLFHWIVSERGEKRGRLHFHGLLFDSLLPKYIVEDCWKFGFVSFKKITLKRCGYVTKYITKGMSEDACQESKEHQPRVWCSPGIGRCYTEQSDALKLATSNGFLVPFIVKNNFVYAMPRYYRDKLFTEEQKQILSAQSLFDCLQPVSAPYSYSGLSFSSLDNLHNALEVDKMKYLKIDSYEMRIDANTDFDNQFNKLYKQYE